VYSFDKKSKMNFVKTAMIWYFKKWQNIDIKNISKTVGKMHGKQLSAIFDKLGAIWQP